MEQFLFHLIFYRFIVEWHKTGFSCLFNSIYVYHLCIRIYTEADTYRDRLFRRSHLSRKHYPKETLNIFE